MKITKVETFILHVPVTRNRIEDSFHQITHWGLVGVMVHTDTGLCGWGYTGTHAHLPTDRLIRDCIAGTYAPLLIGEVAHDVQRIWAKLCYFPPAQWVGRSGITRLALSAVDIALWDLKAKAAQVPLWRFLGGDGKRKLEAYNTDGGWLNWTVKELVADSKRLTGEGYRGVKIKIGGPDPNIDLQRIAAVREAIGPYLKLMVDGNGKWDLPTAMQFGGKFRDYDVFWFEEPIWYDDLRGHTILAQAIETPIALGEQLYTLDDFRNFILGRALHFVQADAVRLGGVTEWLQVADLALAFHLPVVPHIGDMMQVHLHLAIGHSACRMMEYIPWTRDCFVEPASVRDGLFVIPQLAGAGTTMHAAAMERYSVNEA
jgi:L-alanine-DL-glutamate epimerase-like enolase superfamily enzyme